MNRVISLLILALILSGCTSEKGNVSSESFTDEGGYIFAGSSESWKVSYEIDVINKEQGESQVDENGTAEFTGEGEPPKLIDYKLATESGTNSSEGMGIMMNDKVVNFAQQSCENCVPVQIDEGLEVEVMWNGTSEKIILTSKE